MRKLVFPETNRPAELETLREEQAILEKHALTADAEGKRALCRQIQQVKRDIRRNSKILEENQRSQRAKF